jgi:sugar lactone lactonase YvrE
MLLAFSFAAQAQSAPALPLLPNGVAYDTAGNLYFADTNRHQVYESSLAGVLSVVAGSGSQGFSGDGAAATSAQLNSPQGVAIGPDGTLYIADTANQRIRAVLNGHITTFAGNGTAGFGGDAGSALAAEFNGPTALAIDAMGALLVCDSLNHRVRRIASGTITTIAGNGTQGFAGDGAAATAAELDTPSGVAVASDGRIYIADTHNDRIRWIALDGTISTIAGNGGRGFSGDGDAATAASLALPRGLMVTSAGALLFADSNNQRVRMVDTQGIITTIVGSGVQGNSLDGNPATAALLDTPRTVTVSTFGSPVFADAHNGQVRESVSNGSLYVPAGLDSARSSTVSLTAPSTATYGQLSASVSVSGVAGTPQGTVQLLDGTMPIAQATLASGSVSFAPASLAVGTHSLSAVFLGDGVNPAATSAATSVAIGSGTIVATANAESIEYGQAIPKLTGSFTGVLPQDTGDVSVLFTTTAVPLSPPGHYPITATLAGSASDIYVLALSSDSGTLQIDQAASLTSEQPLAQSSYAGLPLVLEASVASSTQGTPTGTVSFSDSGSVIATATLVGGSVTATYLAPAAGNHSIVANYLGDTNFTPSSSQASVTTVGAMPDFSITASGGSSQTVSAEGTANFTLTIAAQPAPFTGVVSLSVKGLPAGATATFTPAQTVPGTGSATSTLSVQTTSSSAAGTGVGGTGLLSSVFVLIPLSLALSRRRAVPKLISSYALLLFLVSGTGCGARSISTALAAQQVSTLQVTGTATNLAGAVVTHSATVTLIVQ